MKKLLLAAVLCLPTLVHAQETPKPDLPALVQTALDNGQVVKLLDQYTFTYKITNRRPDGKGGYKVKSETYEAYVPTIGGKRATKFVRIKTRENDVPISPEKLEKERLKAGERLMKAEAEARRATPDPNGPKSSGIGVYFSLYINSFLGRDIALDAKTLLAGCDFTYVKTEMVNGRDAYVLEFRPRNNVRFSDDRAYLTETVGTAWIDAADKILVRAVGYPRTAADRSNPVFEYRQVRLEDGFWLPLLARLNCAAHKDIFRKMDVDVWAEFSDYKRFTTDAKEDEPAR